MSRSRRVLMVAFHFPPLAGSSGIQRTLSFVRHLGAFGWEPVVLSASPRVYPRTSEDQLGDIPEIVPVIRAMALDTANDLSIAGRYPRALACPDRWVGWLAGAVPAGLRAVRRHRVEAIWSTYPIATAHLVGYALHRLTGLPWVADFRDPMVERDARTGELYPPDRVERNGRLFTERRAARNASRLVFCTRSALEICAARHGAIPRQRLHVIANGFEEEKFVGLERRGAGRPGDGRLTLLHSGVLYATPDRDPTPFLDALARLRAADEGFARRIHVILRASGHEELYAERIRERGLEGIVELAPPVPYREALQEMMDVDGLLLFQGYTSAPAIPAKLYEYLRAGRPVFAMVSEEGETPGLLRELGVGRLARIDDAADIEVRLRSFLDELGTGKVPTLAANQVQQFSRREGARSLATLLSSLEQG